MQNIDFVITWVDYNDPEWNHRKFTHLNNALLEDDSVQRYRDWGLLKYFFRGVEKYAPWVNKIHFVSDNHIPTWLNTDHPKLNIINHESYIPTKYLPTFNSHTIELNLHLIPGLSENFVYFNDDMFLIGPVDKQLFFKNGLPCDTFGFAIVPYGETTIGTINAFNLTVINNRFNKTYEFKQNYRKWLSPTNGLLNVLNTLDLLRWKWFTGFYSNHLPLSYNKTTFKEVWEFANPILEYTCSCKFRRMDNVNHWLMRYWQLISGRFTARKPNIGFPFYGDEELIQTTVKKIQSKKFKMVCINDGKQVEELDRYKTIFSDCFKKLLPEISSYERL